MENTISLYEISNTLVALSEEKNTICATYAKRLARDLDLETVLFKSIKNISKKEITIYVKSKDDIGNDYLWRELTIVQKDNGFISKSPNTFLEVNLFNANSHLQQLFKKLSDIKEYITFQPLKLFDTTKSCNIILTIECIKIRQNNSGFIIIPLDFYKNSNLEDKSRLETLLKSIYVSKSSLPQWLLKRQAEEKTITLDNVIKKLKKGFQDFMTM